MTYTSWNIKRKSRKGRQCLADRLEHARRLRALLAELGLSNPEAAKQLHVSLRTLQNWFSGTHQVPYAVFKCLRLTRYLELPGKAWAGWHFSRGQLVTPEGLTISGHEGSWWSLLVRQARGFGELYRERVTLLAELSEGLVSSSAKPLQDKVGGDAIASTGPADGLQRPLSVSSSPTNGALNRSDVPVKRHFITTERNNSAADLEVGVPVTPQVSLVDEISNQNFPRYEMRQTPQKSSFQLSRGLL